MADFFIDRMVRQVIGEYILDMKDNPDIKKRDWASWISMPKQMLEQYPAAEVYSWLDDCVAKVADETYASGIFAESQIQTKKIEDKKVKFIAGKIRKTIDANLKIIDVAKQFGLEVKKGKALCPFHADGDPSLSFDDEKNIFHCFGCNAKGDIVTFYKRMVELKGGRII